MASRSGMTARRLALSLSSSSRSLRPSIQARFLATEAPPTISPTTASKPAPTSPESAPVPTAAPAGAPTTTATAAATTTATTATTAKPKSLVIPPLPQLATGPPVPAGFKQPNALVTLYSFPSLTPSRMAAYPAAHLLLPVRKDLLQRAVVYEVDCSTQGSANTKWRSEVHGSGRKIRPQKGSGRARLGDKKSPMLRGGGVAHGPRPRDFSTDLPEKIYDCAVRTALSYRFGRGELVVVDGPTEVPFRLRPGANPVDGLRDELAGHIGDVAEELYARLGWAKGVHGPRCLFVTEGENASLEIAVRARPRLGRVVRAQDVEVRDLLKMDRVVIERRALNGILVDHQTDLIKRKGLNPDASTDPRIIHHLYERPGQPDAL